MLKCREVVEIVADTKPIKAWRKPELWFHLLICGACKLYANQMQKLRDVAKNMKTQFQDEQKEKELIEKIIKKL